MRRLAAAFVGLLAVAAALPGCTSPLATAVTLHNAGDLDGAAREVDSPTVRDALKGKGGKDRLLDLMEAGKIQQDGAALRESSETLARASSLSQRFATEAPRTTLGELLGSAIVNPTVRTYRGTYSERIRIDAYQTLNALLMGKLREAAVYGRRTGERQTDAKVEQAKLIEAVNKEIGSWKGGAAQSQIDAIRKDKRLADLDANPNDAAYLDPFASWIAGIAWCSTGDGQEFRQGVSNIQEAAQMMPQNGVLRAQLAANPFDQARAGTPQVIVVFENGVAPMYTQVTIPLFTPWTGVSTIPVQVPQFAVSPVTALHVAPSAGEAVQTELLADYNRIFGAQFKRMEPEIIFSTLVMVAVKEGATVGGYIATNNNSAAQAGVLVAASIYKALTNQCDLRTWRTPGMAIQIAQLPRPADGVLELSLVGGATAPQRVQLPPGQVVLVYVRSCVPTQLRSICAALWGTPAAAQPPTEPPK